MENIVIKNSLDSKLQIVSICFVTILNILEVIAKTSFSKIAKFSTLLQEESDVISLSSDCEKLDYTDPTDSDLYLT